MTVVAEVEAGTHNAAAEVQAVRVVAIAVRGRPVVAERTNVADRSPNAEARGRQEGAAGILQCGPLSGSYHVCGICRTCGVGAVKRVGGCAPVVGNYDKARHSVYSGFGITYARCCATGIQKILPFGLCKCAPSAGGVGVGSLWVIDSIVNSPVVIGAGNVGISVAIIGRCCTCHIRILAIVSTCAPSKQVYPTRVGRRYIAVVSTYDIPLVRCKTPSACGSAATCYGVGCGCGATIFGTPLQIAGREDHTGAGRNGESIGNRSCCSGKGNLAAVCRINRVYGVGTYIVCGTGG